MECDLYFGHFRLWCKWNTWIYRGRETCPGPCFIRYLLSMDRLIVIPSRCPRNLPNGFRNGVVLFRRVLYVGHLAHTVEVRPFVGPSRTPNCSRIRVKEMF